jgi:hypothetical protein
MKDGDLTPRPLLRRREAAHYLKVNWGIPQSPKTLAKKAVVGGGPKFRKAGPWPLYDTPDLDEWARSELSDLVASTSELTTRHHPRASREGRRTTSGNPVEPSNRRNVKARALRHRDETSAGGRRWRRVKPAKSASVSPRKEKRSAELEGALYEPTSQ